MARLKTTKSIDDKILECEEKLRKLKERCDRLTDELDGLYAEKKELESKELLEAIAKVQKPEPKSWRFLRVHKQLAPSFTACD